MRLSGEPTGTGRTSSYWKIISVLGASGYAVDGAVVEFLCFTSEPHPSIILPLQGSAGVYLGR